MDDASFQQLQEEERRSPCLSLRPPHPWNTMGEVTEAVDEEVTKPESCSEPLPLLIILSPPPPFLPVPSKPAIVWNKWLKAFENYVEAIGEKDLVDSSRCMLLQNCLGQEGQRIFSALIPDETSYSATISVLTFYFASSPDTQRDLLTFHQRAQKPNETAQQFVSALEALLKPCVCGDLSDSLILRQLIAKTNCPQLRQRLLLLLQRDGLTLASALVIATEVESSLNHAELLAVHEVSVDIGDDSELTVGRVAKSQRPRRGGRMENAKMCLTKTQRRSSRNKVKCHNSISKLHPSDDDWLQSGEESEEDRGDKRSASLSSSSAVHKASCDDDDDDEDDDFTAKPKLTGPYCPICPNRRFRDANKLARHMRTHTKEKPFSCPLCPLTFSQSYHMTRHMRNQHGAGQYICPTCGQTVGSYLDLQHHKKTHQTLPCSEDRKDKEAFSSPPISQTKSQSTQTDANAPEQIIKTMNEESPLSDDEEGDSDGSDSDDAQDKESEVCIKTEEKESDERGDKKDKVASKTNAKGHFCPICPNRRFRGPNKLARHMRTHTKEKPFGCPVCAMKFSQSYHMTRHLRNQHGLGQYICSKCGKSLGSWLELREHKKTHTVAEGFSCASCEKRFKGKAAFMSHLKTHKKTPSGPRCLVCSDCGKVFGRSYHLKRHIVSHRKATNAECYDCPECQKSYAFPEDLKKHLEIHAKEHSGTCPKCNQTFGSQEELEEHMAVHDRSYVCNTCGKKFKVEYALKKHEKSHQDEQYYCSLCRKHFLKLSHYKRHILVHDRRETRCPHCDSVFLQLTALKYHLRTHTAERPHQCSCCIETFEEEKELEQHCLKHRKFKKERPYSCTRCDLAFPTLVELTEHMGLHDGEQPKNCPVCGKTFLNKNKLEKHLSIHTGERPHLCPLCGNGFPSAASLKLHSHIHTGEKPFKCSQCGKSFKSASGLRLHARQHMEVRPSYECPECGRSYGRMTELKMHQRYHTGDKPYLCTCCSKRFISKDKLNVHMRIHTGERPYSCPHCAQTFTQTGDRNRHIHKYHS